MDISLRLSREEVKRVFADLYIRTSRYHFGDMWIEDVTESQFNTVGIFLLGSWNKFEVLMIPCILPDKGLTGYESKPSKTTTI